MANEHLRVITPNSLAEMAREAVTAEDRAIAGHLALCVELARAGPHALTRRGVTPAAPTPQAIPKHIEFRHPVRGMIEAHVRTGAVYEKSLPSKDKAAIVASLGGDLDEG